MPSINMDYVKVVVVFGYLTHDTVSNIFNLINNRLRVYNGVRIDLTQMHAGATQTCIRKLVTTER